MNRDWAAADGAVAFAIGLDDAWRDRAGGWVNRAVEAFMADGLDPQGPDYGEFEAAMHAYSTLGLHDAAAFPLSGASMAEAAGALERGLAESRSALSALGARMRAEGNGNVAALAAEMAELAADIAAGL